MWTLFPHSSHSTLTVCTCFSFLPSFLSCSAWRNFSFLFYLVWCKLLKRHQDSFILLFLTLFSQKPFVEAKCAGIILCVQVLVFASFLWMVHSLVWTSHLIHQHEMSQHLFWCMILKQKHVSLTASVFCFSRRWFNAQMIPLHSDILVFVFFVSLLCVFEENLCRQ